MPAAPGGMELIQLAVAKEGGGAALLYLPGTDGTGQSILPQLPSLSAGGFDVWTLYLPMESRAGWADLTAGLADLLRELLAHQQQHGARPGLTLVCESFGGCLGLRLALADPGLLSRLVLINPATSYNQSLNGLSAFVGATNLLGLFPQGLYSVAQATLLPLLVDSKRITPASAELLRRMINMDQPHGFATNTIISLPPGAASPDSPDSPSASSNGSGQRGGPGVGGLLPSSLTDSLPLYGPAAAANFRVNLLTQGDLPDEQLQRVSVPTLVITSARDRLLPSIQEGARLLRLIPGSVRIILPDSGHAALLETEVDLAALLEAPATSARTEALAGGVAEPGASPPAAVSGVTGTSAPGSSANDLPRDGVLSEASAAGPSSRGRLTAEQRAERSGLSGAKAVAQSSAVDSWNEMAQLLAPWRDLVSPRVYGASNLPPVGSKAWGRPMLFVGNHGKMGFYDTPLLMYELFLRGYKVRGLAHPGHWRGPFGSLFERFGAVKASPMAAFRLLRSSEKVLLFPGGAREVVKRRGEEYKLLWKESPDFVRLAAKCKAIIVPFAAVGADDAYDVIMETPEVLEAPVLGNMVKGLLERVGQGLEPEESIFPVTRLPLLGLPTPIPVPNLTRLYFKFAPPVDTAELNLDLGNEAECQALYDCIRATIRKDLNELLALRDADDDRDFSTRFTGSVATLLSTVGSVQISTGAEASEAEQL